MAVSGFVTLLILVALGGAIYRITADKLGSESTDRLREYAADLSGRQSQPEEGSIDLTFGGDYAGILALRIDTASTVYSLSRAPLPVGLPDWDAVGLAMDGQSDVRVETVTLVGRTGSTEAISVRVYSRPIVKGGHVVGVFQMVGDRTEETSLLAGLLWVLIVGGILALMAALAAGYLYAGRALVPIRASIDRRQAALQRQREFAANASHELRTPLTVIGTSVEDLKRNRRSRVSEVGEALDDIDAEVKHMTALVEDMLMLARTDSGVVQVERVSLDLADTAADVAGAMATLGQERGVRVLLDPLPTPVVGDPMRLRQLVTILTDNAVRHSPKGTTVTVTVRPAPNGSILKVEDEGPGIKPEDLSRLFERFWRADDAPTGGTGLGLAIAQWIVERHSGQITASNRPEGGAAFHVWLPSESIVPPGEEH
jgi:signal transduction histidine kinase